MKNEIEITGAGFGDVEIIAQFQVDMALETESLELDKDKVLKGVRAVVEDSSKGMYYVARVDGKAIGSLLLTKEWSDWNNEFYWWIQSVYVDPEFRGQGVFTSIYKAVENEASRGGIPQLRLYVDKTNLRAQKCYQKLGMKESHYLLYEEEL